MQDYKIFYGLNKPLFGNVSMLGDKSIAHRALIFACIANGSCIVSNIPNNKDVLSTINALQKLGGSISLQKTSKFLFDAKVKGWGSAGPNCKHVDIDCANSGTTARLLMGLLSAYNIQATFIGDASLSKRPMQRIVTPLQEMGMQVLSNNTKTLPITIKGSTNLSAINYTSLIGSAQLKSAILLAALFANQSSTYSEAHKTRNHTELMMEHFGIDIKIDDKITITPKSDIKSKDISIVGDASSAAFLCCAATLCKSSKIVINNVGLNPGRIEFINIMQKFGANIIVEHLGKKSCEDYGNIFVQHSSNLHATSVEAHLIASIIDEIPMLSLIAACASGTSVFYGVQELKHKESDRLQAIVEGLASLNVNAFVEDNNLFIQGNPLLRQTSKSGVEIKDFDCKSDHRLACVWALVGLCNLCPTKVYNFSSIDVSYPNFLDDIERLTNDNCN